MRIKMIFILLLPALFVKASLAQAGKKEKRKTNKKIFLMIVYILFFLQFYAQPKNIDSLKNRLEKVSSKKDSLRIYIELARTYYLKSMDKELDRTILFLNKDSSKINDYFIIGSIYQINAVKNLDNKEYSKVIENGLKALQFFKKKNDTLRISETVNLLVIGYIHLKNISEAQLLFDKYKDVIRLKYKYLILMQLSYEYLANTQYNKVKDLLNEAFLIAQQLGNKQYIGKVLYRIAVLNNSLKNYKEAETKALQALKILDKKKNILLYGAVYKTLSEILEREEKYETALKYADSALLCYKGHMKSIGIVLKAKAFILMQLKRNKEAKATIEKAIELHKKVKNSYSLGFDYLTYSNILFSINKSDTNAIYFMKQAIRLGNKYKIKHLIKAANYNLANMYYENKRYKEAFGRLKLAFKYADSIYQDKILKDLKEIETKYQAEKKEKENQRLLAEKYKQEALIQQKNKQNLLLAGGLGMAVTVAGLFGFFYTRNRRQKQLIEDLQKDLHHRVKNNLGVISSLVDEIKNQFREPELQARLNDLHARIMSIHKIHEQLYKEKNVYELRLKDYLEKLVESVQKAYGRDDVEVNIRVDEKIKLNPLKTFPLGLIVAEFLSNSFKHAFKDKDYPGRIAIEVEQAGDKYVLKLSDNGPGPEKEIDFERSDSYGIRIMKGMAKQMGARLKLYHDKGMRMELAFG